MGKIGEIGDPGVRTCDEGEVLFEGECQPKKEVVRRLIHRSEMELGPAAQAYYNALDDAERRYGQKGLDAQIRYLYVNLAPLNKKQRLAKQNILNVVEEKPFVTELPPETLEMNELELSNICTSFERATERKVSRGEKISMGDIDRFATSRGYPVEKVLVAQDWVNEVLEPEVIKRKKEAEEKVTIHWD